MALLHSLEPGPKGLKGTDIQLRLAAWRPASRGSSRDEFRVVPFDSTRHGEKPEGISGV